MLQVATASAPSPRRHTPETWMRRGRRILSRAFGRGAACIFELHESALDLLPHTCTDLPDGHDFRLAQLDDLPECARMAGMPKAVYEERFHRGDECYITTAFGTPINLSWIHRGSCYVRGLGLIVDGQANDGYVYNVYTDAQHRGKGVYRATQRRLIDLLLGRQLARLRQLVMWNNDVPLAVLPQLGYRPAKRIRHRRVFGLKITSIHDLSSDCRSWQVGWRQPGRVVRI